MLPETVKNEKWIYFPEKKNLSQPDD